jgi:hypothetical protein
MIPGAIARDAHARMATSLGVPAVHGGKLPLVDESLEIGEA